MTAGSAERESGPALPPSAIRPSPSDYAALHILEEPRAGLAQPGGKHGYELDQDLRSQAGMVEDDLRHVVTVEHGEHGGLGGDAGGEARLAVDHGHLAQRHAWPHVGHVLLLAAHVALEDVHRAFDDEQHEVAAVVLADDGLAGL